VRAIMARSPRVRSVYRRNLLLFIIRELTAYKNTIPRGEVQFFLVKIRE
jgi:hypothetical protein